MPTKYRTGIASTVCIMTALCSMPAPVYAVRQADIESFVCAHEQRDMAPQHNIEDNQTSIQQPVITQPNTKLMVRRVAAATLIGMATAWAATHPEGAQKVVIGTAAVGLLTTLVAQGLFITGVIMVSCFLQCAGARR